MMMTRYERESEQVLQHFGDIERYQCCCNCSSNCSFLLLSNWPFWRQITLLHFLHTRLLAKCVVKGRQKLVLFLLCQ